MPNSLVEQWGEEFLRLYPSANILVAGEKDFSPSNRKMFCSKIATCDYDAVIITYSQFTKIPISESFQEKYIKKQLNELENLTEEARQNRFGRNGEIRGLEAAKKRLKVQLSKLRDQKIRMIRFTLNSWVSLNYMLMKHITLKICSLTRK